LFYFEKNAAAAQVIHEMNYKENPYVMLKIDDEKPTHYGLTLCETTLVLFLPIVHYQYL
jgi:hypothetical protein